MNQTKVSVLMSCFNEDKKWIDEAVLSILNQTYKNIQFIIVVDNPNNNELIETIRNYKKCDNRIFVIENEENLGLVKSLNKGLHYAQGEYIARMDADDISNTSRIEEQVEYMTNNPHIDLAYSNVTKIDEKGCKLEYKKQRIVNVEKLLRYQNVSFHPTWIVKRKLMCDPSINGYRNIPYAEDYDLLLRLLCKNKKIGFINSELLQYRVRSSSVTSQNYAEQVAITHYLSKVFNKRRNSYCSLNIIDDFRNSELVETRISLFLSLESNDRVKFLKGKYPSLIKLYLCCTSKYHRFIYFNKIRVLSGGLI